MNPVDVLMQVKRRHLFHTGYQAASGSAAAVRSAMYVEAGKSAFEEGITERDGFRRLLEDMADAERLQQMEDDDGDQDDAELAADLNPPDEADLDPADRDDADEVDDDEDEDTDYLDN